MRETQGKVREVIPEQVMLGRIAQSEQMREFFIQMWMQNPALAKQGGVRVQSLLTRLERVEPEAKAAAPSSSGMARQRGISLIELIMFIVIISVAMVGILTVMNLVTRNSADPLIRKQALAVAEAMLEEIKLQDLPGVATCIGTLGPDGVRTGVTSVCDYNGYSSTGIHEFTTANAVVPGLENYNIDSVVINNTLGTFGGLPISAGSGVQITVTVRDSMGEKVDVTGYRAGR
jgi:MSHA pilin protein MshD